VNSAAAWLCGRGKAMEMKYLEESTKPIQYTDKN
jgi:hypothetical protein